MKFKVASVRFFADRRPTLRQSKGKKKKALNVWKLLSCMEYTSFSIHLFTSDVYGPVQLQAGLNGGLKYRLKIFAFDGFARHLACEEAHMAYLFLHCLFHFSVFPTIKKWI